MVRKKKYDRSFIFIFLVNKFAIFAEVLVFAPIHNENEKQKSIVS